MSRRGGAVVAAVSALLLVFLTPSAAVAAAPSNDNFENAATISALPFSNTVNVFEATLQEGEPTPSCGTPAGGTVWYAFTPAETVHVSARSSGSWLPFVAAYTGSALADLSQVGCANTYSPLTFRATAGQTYYFQVGSFFRPGGFIQFDLDVALPPNASFTVSPPDPSTYDTVQFYNTSYDPAGTPGAPSFASVEWDFGDGATATGYSVSHRFAADGGYMVRLTVTTTDGRTGSTSQVVYVSTHDVTITKISAPQSANAGQTRLISVEVKSNFYPETVRVDFYKSDANFGGFQSVGSLTKSVPGPPSNRTTSFAIFYTFTDLDATRGTVTFKAVATLLYPRDALPANNEATASPTRVNP